MQEYPPNEKWYRVLHRRLQQYQFNWMGKTKDGVHRWIGAPRGPSARAGKYMTMYGITVSVVGLVATAAIVIRPAFSSSLALLAGIAALHGVIFTFMGLWMQKMQKRLATYQTVEELAKQFGSTPETVTRLAEAHNIRAQIIINDTNLYDPNQFLASRSLLRGASSPLSADTLLRAAASTSDHGAQETLLRAVDVDTVGLTPIQRLFLDSDDAIDAETSKQIVRRQ